MQLISRIGREISGSQTPRVSSPSVNLKKKQYLRLQSVSKDVKPKRLIFNPLKQINSKSSKKSKQKQSLTTLFETKSIFRSVLNYLHIKDIKQIISVNRKMRMNKLAVHNYIATRISQFSYKNGKQIIYYLKKYDLMKQYKFLASVPCKIQIQIYQNVKQIHRIKIQNIQIVFELTKCFRLKYSQYNYHRNIPLIIYNILMIVGQKNSWDTITMLVDQTEFPKIFDSNIEASIVKLVNSKITSLRNLKCMRSIQTGIFYQTGIKRLFIGNSIKLWSQFLVLFISEGWEIVGRLIFYLTTQLVLKGTVQDWITEQSIAHLAKQQTLQQRQFVNQLLEIIDIKKKGKQRKQRRPLDPLQYNSLGSRPGSSYNKGFRVFSKYYHNEY